MIQEKIQNYCILWKPFELLQLQYYKRGLEGIYQTRNPLHYMFYNYVYLYPCFMVVNQCDGSENDSFTLAVTTFFSKGTFIAI